jgi:hypothetical protein
MKRITLTALLTTALLPASWIPTETDLQRGIQRAEIAWGEKAEVRGIAMADLGGCTRIGTMDRYAWTDLVSKTITLNLNCNWDKGILEIVLAHEYGHLVLQSVAHSLNRKSAIFWCVMRGQKVLPEDRERLTEKVTRERPTLRMPEESGQ